MPIANLQITYQRIPLKQCLTYLMMQSRSINYSEIFPHSQSQYYLLKPITRFIATYLQIYLFNYLFV